MGKLATLKNDKLENAITEMMKSIIGIVIKGGQQGSKGTLQFLAKDKNQKALQYLKHGFKGVEVSKLTGAHIITKIKKLGLI